MSSTYTPNPANNPTSITIPSDGQGPIKAADVNPAFEALADLIAYARAHLTKQVDTFTANGTWTCPANVTSVDVDCIPPGGGGGSGSAGGNVADIYPIGGAGGGASIRQSRRITVVPATVYDVTIGVGGIGAIAGGAPTPAGDAKIQATGGGAVVFRARGAAGGASGGILGAPSGTPTQFGQSLGGGPVQSGGEGLTISNTTEQWHPSAPGLGGDGIDNRCSARPGCHSLEFTSGGAAIGTPGTNSGSMRGGGIGGGGAAGPGGGGANGGSGGNAGNAGGTIASHVGTAGANAAANTGAGGGGGGAGGAGGDGGSAGGAGGNGGSGWIQISYVKVG